MAGLAPLAQAPAEEWWPFRNQLLATLAAAWAVGNGISELAFASVKSDATHSDGRDEFFAALCRLVELQEGGVRIVAPVIGLSTEELIKKSGMPRNWLGWTHSCFVGGMACGHCRGCKKRSEVLRNLEPAT